ncbi:MAG: hypothetical protein LLF75_01010 [Eubacteriales bacterium]|nr:hypothetical protein [Eubacteriales bacterium]
MEVTSNQQPTLSEFASPTKAQRVWRLILAILLTAMILGATYEITKPKPEPVRMTRESREDTFSYLDLQLLSDWIYKVTGDDNYTFYEAMDADGNWFILSLDDKTFASLSPYVDAYEAYFSESPQSGDYPEPKRLTGMPSYISYDDASQLAQYYEITIDEFEQFFGSYFFHEGASNAMENAALYLVGAFLFGLFFLAVVLQISSTRKHRKKSEDRLYQLGLLDEAEAQFSDPGNSRFEKLRLTLSRDFAYVGINGYILPYTDIGWLYKRTQRNHGITVATQLAAGTIYGKTILLAARSASDEFNAAVAQKVLTKNPDCLVGYTFEQARLNSQRVKAYKANNPQ